MMRHLPVVFLLIAGFWSHGPSEVRAQQSAALPEIQLVVEAPPELAAVAEEIRSVDPESFRAALELTGFGSAGQGAVEDKGRAAVATAPIRVILGPEGSPLAERAPPWVSGYAYPELSTVVLLPGRLQTYPHDSLEEVLRHEVAHVLIGRAAAGREVPRWFHEGLAMAAAGEWRLEDRTHLAIALVRARRVSLAGLDQYFGQSAAASTRAYALSAAFMRHVRSRYGDDVPAQVLAALAEDQGFTRAFQGVTGVYLDEAETTFWKKETFWVRWLPVLTSSTLLWIAISLLALWAIKRRRERDAERLREWEEQEEWAALRAAKPVRQDARLEEELVN